MIDRDRLRNCAAAYNVSLDEAAAEKLELYARLLVQWNERMNLTAITDPEGILRKHFVDSLTVLPHLPAGPCRLIDVGTGAGFPGVPLAVVRGDLQLTLLDSLNKRLVFLRELCAALELPVTLIHARAEEGGRQPALREQFDVATARAVARLGGAPAKVHTVLLPAPPDGEAAEERRLLVIDKIAATPSAYPRPSAKIARQPL